MLNEWKMTQYCISSSPAIGCLTNWISASLLKTSIDSATQLSDWVNKVGLYPHSIWPCQMPLISGIGLGVHLCSALLYTTWEFLVYTLARYTFLATFLIEVPSHPSSWLLDSVTFQFLAWIALLCSRFIF